MEKTKLVVKFSLEQIENRIRLDKYIVTNNPKISRSQLQNRLLELKLNNRDAKLAAKVEEGDVIEFLLEELPSLDIKAEKIELDILYEDDDTLVVYKPQGMVVHPASGHYSGTLVNALLGLNLLDKDFVTDYDKENQEDKSFRPGIVHRLDKDTSGVILVAKHLEAHQYYSSLFRKKKVKKRYIAIIKGVMPLREGEIESWIARDRNNRKKFIMTRGRGKECLTRYWVLKESTRYSLLQLSPETGRTHQLRVHLSGSGYPIVGDPLYSRRDKTYPDKDLMLHAWKIEFPRFSDRKKVRIKTEIPDRILDLLEELEIKI